MFYAGFAIGAVYDLLIVTMMCYHLYRAQQRANSNRYAPGKFVSESAELRLVWSQDAFYSPSAYTIRCQFRRFILRLSVLDVDKCEI